MIEVVVVVIDSKNRRFYHRCWMIASMLATVVVGWVAVGHHIAVELVILRIHRPVAILLRYLVAVAVAGSLLLRHFVCWLHLSFYQIVVFRLPGDHRTESYSVVHRCTRHWLSLAHRSGAELHFLILQIAVSDQKSVPSPMIRQIVVALQRMVEQAFVVGHRRSVVYRTNRNRAYRTVAAEVGLRRASHMDTALAYCMEIECMVTLYSEWDCCC